MSFSTDVKNEIINHSPSALHCRIAYLAGILMMSAELRETEDKKSLIIKTESDICADKIRVLFKQLFKMVPDERISQSVRGEIFRFEIDKDDEIKAVFDKLKLCGTGHDLMADNVITTSDCCKKSFLTGTFLSGGSVNDPEKAYHFEIVTDNSKKAEKIRALMQRFELESKIVVRKKYHVVYIKESQAIVEALGLMGAHISLMNMENVRIIKDIRNKLNRQVNCDVANTQKRAVAVAKYNEDIRYIQNKIGLNALPEGLRKIAILRMEETELSLKDLGEMLDPPLGKSGVNHRLRKISEIADKLRES